MPVRSFHCENCGAPLPTDGRKRSVRCLYCNALLRLDDDVVKVAAFQEALAEVDDELTGVGALPLVEHAGRRYRLLGRIASGQSSDVFLAHWCRRVGERVLLKVPRSRDDEDLLLREFGVLRDLAQSVAPGAEVLARRVPQTVAHGALRERPDDGGRPALTLRYLSGFAHTLADVRAAHPAGLDPRHLVWLWRRLAEVLGFARVTGFVHGAVLPEHVVVHARDHGVMLVGWSCAVRPGQALPAVSEPQIEFYPDGGRSGGEVSTDLDLVMAARTLGWVLGAAPDQPLPPSVPRPLGALLDDYRHPEGRLPLADGQALSRRIAEVARAVYGPPAYVKLALSGWR